MKATYPQSFDDIRLWAKERGIPVNEARARFAQYGVLRAIADSRRLSQLLIFKGGNALDFIWQPNRSTTDLDFSVDMRQVDTAINEKLLSDLLDRALIRAGRELNITFRIQRIRPNPPGENKTFVTYEASIGYALQDDAALLQRIERQQPVSTTIALDISLNEVVCAITDVSVAGTYPLRTCTLEDIIAEKLRSLLQQPIRNRQRPQDLLDIAVCLKEHGETIDRDKVSHFLLEKAAARDVPVSIQAFHDGELVERAKIGYEELEAKARETFISFDGALTALHAFVAILSIPTE